MSYFKEKVFSFSIFIFIELIIIISLLQSYKQQKKQYLENLNEQSKNTFLATKLTYLNRFDEFNQKLSHTAIKNLILKLKGEKNPKTKQQIIKLLKNEDLSQFSGTRIILHFKNQQDPILIKGDTQKVQSETKIPLTGLIKYRDQKRIAGFGKKQEELCLRIIYPIMQNNSYLGFLEFSNPLIDFTKILNHASSNFTDLILKNKYIYPNSQNIDREKFKLIDNNFSEFIFKKENLSNTWKHLSKEQKKSLMTKLPQFKNFSLISKPRPSNHIIISFFPIYTIAKKELGYLVFSFDTNFLLTQKIKTFKTLIFYNIALILFALILYRSLKKKFSQEDSHRYKLNKLFDLLDSGIILIDNDNNILDSNSQAEEIMRSSANEIKGLSYDTIFYKTEAKSNFDYINTGQKPIAVKTSLNKIKINNRLIKLLSFRKIGPEVENVSKANVNLEMAIEQSPFSQIIITEEGYINYMNESFRDVFCKNNESELGNNKNHLKELDFFQKHSELLEDFKRTIYSDMVYKKEHNFYLNKNNHWFNLYIFPIIKNTDIKTRYYSMIFENITDKKYVEEALNHEKGIFRDILNSIPDPICLKNKNGKYIACNPSFEKLIGEKRNKIIGKTDFDLEDKTIARIQSEKEKIVLNTAKPFHKEEWVKMNDHKTLMDSFIVPYYSTKGLISGTIQISRDITQIRKNEEELMKARDAAEKANQTKSLFLANMSHEIRTPLNGIIGMADLLLHAAKDDSKRQDLQVIQDSAHSLLKIINDILDFSKIETGELTLNPIKFDIVQYLEKVIDLFALKAYGKGLNFILDVQPDIETNVFGDCGRLRQILSNLISNAIKFTEKGSVRINLNQVNTESNDRYNYYVFRIIDTGIGIPKEKIDNIFDNFVQLDSSLTKKHSGTGLGLAITKKLVNLLQGEIEVKSEEGLGSEFIIKLPFLNDESKTTNLIANFKKIRYKRIIILRDSLNKFEIIEKHLSFLGSEYSVSDELIRLDEIYEGAEKTDILIIENNLLQDTACELLKNIIKTQKCPVIIAKELQAKDFVCKTDSSLIYTLPFPIKRTDFLNTLSQILNPTQKMSVNKEITSPKITFDKRKSSNKRILLAEDNETNQKVIELLLRKRKNIELEIVENGKDAVQKIEEKKFDLILMDIQMPILDGIKATRMIREGNVQPEIPIIAITAYALKGDKKRFLKAGMDDYLKKPVDISTLEKLINRYLDKANKPKIKISKNTKQTKKHIDISMLTKMPNISAEFIENLAEELYRNYEKLIIQYEKGLENKDSDQIMNSINGLKDTFSNFKAKYILDQLRICKEHLQKENFNSLENDRKKIVDLFEIFKNKLEELIKNERNKKY